MKQFADMHCHILPGVDDGARDAQEMQAMLQMAYQDGTRMIVATPHCHPGRGKSTPRTLIRQLGLLREAAYALDENFRIRLGTEIYYDSDTVDGLKRGEILTMNQTRCVLVEFSPSHSFAYVRRGIQELQAAGYDVILAHVERYPDVISDMEQVEELCEMDVMLQVNAGSITGDAGRTRKKAVKNMMDEDLIFCVGTDAHGTKERPPKMRKAAGYVQKHYGEDYCNRLFSDNIKEILGEVEDYE